MKHIVKITLTGIIMGFIPLASAMASQNTFLLNIPDFLNLNNQGYKFQWNYTLDPCLYDITPTLQGASTSIITGYPKSECLPLGNPIKLSLILWSAKMQANLKRPTLLHTLTIRLKEGTKGCNISVVNGQPPQLSVSGDCHKL